MATIVPLKNENIEWNSFDPEYYCQHNYESFRGHNAGIVAAVASYLSNNAPRDSNCLDIGTGSNLYPTLLLHPWARSITLIDPSKANRDWLKEEFKTDGSRWEQYWQVCYGVENEVYLERFEWAKIRRITRVVSGGFRKLPVHEFDIGAMFFVAESVTGDRDEFEEFTERFIKSVRPGGHVIAAFMLGSDGYTVGDHTYPAVRLEHNDLKFAERMLSSFKTINFARGSSPVRKGYSGMSLLMGKTAR